MLLLLDNYDSFTYNIYQLLAELGREVEVIRNDQTAVEEIAAKKYEAIVISPGPGTPAESGICKEVVHAFAGRIPLFGVCLGHQAIAETFGGRIIRAPYPVHGKTAALLHDNGPGYEGIAQGMRVGRYHSLIVERASLPDCLEVASWLEDGMIMGIRHKAYFVEGVQFHPESILTPGGKKIMENFLARAGA